MSTARAPYRASAGSILTINGGSSSVKFALYGVGESLQRRLYGKVDRIGLPGTRLIVHGDPTERPHEQVVDAGNHRSACDVLADHLEPHLGSVAGMGHRVVHGLQHREAERITPALLEELRRIVAYDPDHLPLEIGLIEFFRTRYPRVSQVACFDTAFHRTLPRVAQLLPIPRRFDAMGVQRYGFHGLSYAYLMEELARVAGTQAAQGRIILAHLGNGASMAAVRGGSSIDTSMGFTPAGGLPMGTRPGDLDPGVAWYLMQSGNLTSRQFSDLVNHECGLAGVSETSSDMRDLVERETTDVRAAEAVALFCYQARKWIGAFAAALGGLDTLVFAGGIGENAPAVRVRICDGLEFLGVNLDVRRNEANAALVSTDTGRVAVRVMRTDEEQMIARATWRVLNRTDG